MTAADKKDEGGAALAGDDPLLSPWRDAAKSIRETAKWLVTLFGGIGAVLVGTAPFTGAGDLSGDDLITAIVFGLLALGGLTLVIWRVSDVLLPETTSLTETLTAGTLKDFRTQVSGDRWSYLGAWAETLQDFKTARDLEFATFLEVDQKLRDPSLSDNDRAVYNAELPGLTKRLQTMELATARLLAKATYHEVRTRFIRARRWLFVGGLAAAVGIFGFLTTVTAKKDDKETKPAAAVSLSRRATVALSAAGTERFRRFVGENCPTAAVPLIVLDGEEKGPWRVLVRDESGCRPVSFLLSKEEGVPAFQ